MQKSLPSTTQAMRRAAEAAVSAPSIFNTQPWRWQVEHGVLRLWADRARQLLVADPDGRLLTVSCGAGLHHARISLAAAGYDVVVSRLPDPADPDLLAEIEPVGERASTQAERDLAEAIPQRRTDRRAFTPDPVDAESSSALINAAEAEGAHLHLIGKEDVAVLALAAVQAGAAQMADANYRQELIRWTHRPVWSGDGVPAATAVSRSPRSVPVRDFFHRDQVTPAGPNTDHGALYAVIFTDDDTPLAWLQAGEALSVVLLTATSRGLGTAPISDVTELTVTRQQLRQLLPDMGMPQLAVRIGHPPLGTPAIAPRRLHDEVIYP